MHFRGTYDSRLVRAAIANLLCTAESLSARLGRATTIARAVSTFVGNQLYNLNGLGALEYGEQERIESLLSDLNTTEKHGHGTTCQDCADLFAVVLPVLGDLRPAELWDFFTQALRLQALVADQSAHIDRVVSTGNAAALPEWL